MFEIWVWYTYICDYLIRIYSYNVLTQILSVKSETEGWEIIEITILIKKESVA